MTKDKTLLLAASLAMVCASNFPIFADGDRGATDQQVQDSRALQTKILNDISVAVVGGYMSAEKAAGLQETLNAIAMSESQYKSLNQLIPPDLNASNMIVLKRMLIEVDGATEIKPDQDLNVNSMKVGVHRMITRSLAAGKINNVQANDYYGLLAGIEADEAELAHSTGIARARAVENLKGRLSALQKTLEQKIGKSPGAINTSALCETLLIDLKADLSSSKLNQLEAYLMRKEVDRLTAKKQQIDAIMKDTNSTEESSLQGLATELNTLKVQVNKELSRRPATLSTKRVR